jgi:prefoldin subunit 5
MEEIAGELYEEEREYNPVPLGVCVCDAASAIMCEKLLEECDFLVIDLEKLCESLSANANFSKKSQEDNVPLDALRQIIGNIQKTVQKKKKRVILSLGKTYSVEGALNDMIKDFTFISASSESISKIKKGWQK